MKNKILKAILLTFMGGTYLHPALIQDGETLSPSLRRGVNIPPSVAL